MLSRRPRCPGRPRIERFSWRYRSYIRHHKSCPVESRMSIRSVRALLLIGLLSPELVAMAQKTPVTIADAIEMTRIQHTYSTDDRTVTFSPDGLLFATLIWRGDLAQDI